MIGSLIAYNAAGEIIGTLGHLVQYAENGTPLGLVDFAAHEEAGGKLRDVWTVSDAIGSGTWPEWLGAGAHNFRVELVGKQIIALVHRTSGQRRERATIEAAIAKRILEAEGKPADIRDLVGGPDRPLALDDEGRTTTRPTVTRPDLPLVGVRR
jgi:hypothetical protein